MNLRSQELPCPRYQCCLQLAANKIEISAAILRPPFFYPGMDAAVNIGTLGAVIGHEMMHGFDSIGRRLDAVGNLTVTETLTDLGGMTLAFNALKVALAGQSNPNKIDGYTSGRDLVNHKLDEKESDVNPKNVSILGSTRDRTVITGCLRPQANNDANRCNQPFPYRRIA
jgi:hypothetical protein